MTICTDLKINALAFDRWKIDQMKKQFDDLSVDTGPEGHLPMIPHGQGMKDMAPAIDALEAELLNGRIAHANHPVLTMCAANSVTMKDAAENRKFAKDKATGRIDGMVALAMALESRSNKVRKNRKKSSKCSRFFVDIDVLCGVIAQMTLLSINDNQPRNLSRGEPPRRYIKRSPGFR